MIRAPRYGWELQAHTWRTALQGGGEWRGSRAAVLAEARRALEGASMEFLKMLKAKGWRSPEDLVP